MAYEVRAEEIPDRLVASVRRHASMATVGKEIPEAFRELMQAIEPVGYGEGAPGVVYLGDVGPQTEWEMEIFIPVAAPFEPPEGMEVKTLPGATCASTVHRGPYEECGPAYEAVTAWIHEQGYEPAGPPQELYLNDPTEVGEDEALTQILFPIR
jgi:effector-binding domain-containing protein